MQDELALVRQDLHHAQQQLFREAAKQEPKDFQLMKVYEEAIRNLTAREERLMEEARAMRLDAQAPGEQSYQSACLTMVDSVSVEAWKSSVGETGTVAAWQGSIYSQSLRPLMRSADAVVRLPSAEQ